MLDIFSGLSGLFHFCWFDSCDIRLNRKTKWMVLLVVEKTIGNLEEMGNLHLRWWRIGKLWETDLRRHESMYVILLWWYYSSLPHLLTVLAKLPLGELILFSVGDCVRSSLTHEESWVKWCMVPKAGWWFWRHHLCHHPGTHKQPRRKRAAFLAPFTERSG